MPERAEESVSHAEWILALAGFCLILLQFFMIREVTALLRGTEIVILLVTLAYFVGYSVGYGVAHRLSLKRIRNLALVTWAIHLTLPFSFRYLGGFLWGKTATLSLVVMLFLSAFALSSFYSVLLPRFIDQAAEGAGSLMRYYGFELLGAALGVMCLFVAGSVWWLTPLLYQVALAAMVALLWNRTLVWWIGAAGVLVYALAFPRFEKNSLSYSYATIHQMKDTDVLHSVNTLYQKVDILRDGDGNRHIYLSGRQNYGSTSLTRFNVFLSQVPAKLVRPKEALIIGSGSMESVWHVSQFADHVTTVELDPAVIEGSRKFLRNVNHLDEIKNWTLVIDDAKQFLGGTDKRFDLIVMDVPAPATIQLGLLHSVEFYRLAQSRLNPQGVISVSLCGTFSPENETPRSIAAALAEVFENVVPYTPSDAGRSFAVASDILPFSTDDLRDAVLDSGAPDVLIFPHPQMIEVIAGAKPITADNMRIVMTRSWDHLDEFYLPEVLQ